MEDVSQEVSLSQDSDVSVFIDNEEKKTGPQIEEIYIYGTQKVSKNTFFKILEKKKERSTHNKGAKINQQQPTSEKHGV